MNKNWIWISMLVAGMLLSACGQAVTPAAPRFDGTWTTNVGILTLTQNGDQVAAEMAGYGDFWKFSMTGAIKDNTLSFTGSDLPWGDVMNITFAGDGQSFRSDDPSLVFCGSRSATLPVGCGFSGKWMMNYVMAHDGAYADLTQTGDQVTGTVYDPTGKAMSAVKGTVEWGKGWHATVEVKWQKQMLLSLTADEKAFEIDSGMDFCALRDTETTAYVFYFDCQP